MVDDIMENDTIDPRLFVISFAIIIGFIFALNTQGYSEEFFENFNLDNPFAEKTYSIHGDLEAYIQLGDWIAVSDFTVKEGEYPTGLAQGNDGFCMICVISKVKSYIHLYDDPNQEPVDTWVCEIDELTFLQQLSPLKELKTCSYQFDGLTSGIWYVGAELIGYTAEEETGTKSSHIRSDIKKITIKGDIIEITDNAEEELIKRESLKDLSIIIILIEIFAGIMSLAFITNMLKNIGSPKEIAIGMGLLVALILIFYIHTYQGFLKILPGIAATGSAVWIVFFGFSSFIIMIGTVFKRR